QLLHTDARISLARSVRSSVSRPWPTPLGSSSPAELAVGSLRAAACSATDTSAGQDSGSALSRRSSSLLPARGELEHRLIQSTLRLGRPVRSLSSTPNEGRLLWAGDLTGLILAFLVDPLTGHLTRSRTLSTDTSCAAYFASGPRPLSAATCSAGFLLLFRVMSGERPTGPCAGSSAFPHLPGPRSVPDVLRQGACVVCASSDTCVYIVDVTRERRPIVNKLQGHASPVTDVTFNYERTRTDAKTGRQKREKKREKEKRDHGYHHSRTTQPASTLWCCSRTRHMAIRQLRLRSCRRTGRAPQRLRLASRPNPAGTLSPKAKKTKSFKLPTKKSILKKGMHRTSLKPTPSPAKASTEVSGVKIQGAGHHPAYNLHLSVELSDYDPFVVASVVKNFIRELPECVLTENCCRSLKGPGASGIRSRRLKHSNGSILSAAPNYMLLAYTLLHMSHVWRIRPRIKMSLQTCCNVFFSHLDELFSGVVIKRYVAPLRPQARMEIPETLEDVEAELAKQESLLEWLHQELSALKSDGLDSQDKSNLIWEVQRVVTALKTKKTIEKRAAQAGTSLNRLHATLTGCPTDDQETQDQLWEVQRTITMLKRKLRKLPARPGPACQAARPRERQPASQAPAASAQRVGRSREQRRRRHRQIAVVPNSWQRHPTGHGPLWRRISNSIWLCGGAPAKWHRGDAAAPSSAGSKFSKTQPSSVQQPLPQPQSQQPQTLPQPQPQQQPPPQPSPPEPPQEPPQPLRRQSRGRSTRLDSLRESSRCGDSSIGRHGHSNVELYALTRNPPPLELRKRAGRIRDGEGDGEYEERRSREEEEKLTMTMVKRDLDQLAYRLEEEENQLLCASEVEEETRDLLAVVEDLRRLRLEEEELAQLSDELGMRVARERQEDGPAARRDRSMGQPDQRPAGGPDNCPDTSSSASSDSEDESDSALLSSGISSARTITGCEGERGPAERCRKRRMLAPSTGCSCECRPPTDR
uniref:Rho-GAP domain-containing protein n=1 Tax=Macrostomum lignano TaxID=282301 RepID=A0A1I8F450_9PLAT